MMTDRDTTSTPYKLSADGLVYFRYPDGDAPVVAVADYAELRLLGKSSASAVTVTGQYIAGLFLWSANDKKGNGDDGGTIIAASDGGWWSRSYAYSLDSPVELDWYDLSDNDDVTGIFEQIYSYHRVKFFVRMPSRTLTVGCTHKDFYWDSVAVKQFALLQSDVPTVLKFTDDAAVTVWYFGSAMTTFVLGSVEKPAEHNLTLWGGWRPDNRLIDRDNDRSAITISGIAPGSTRYLRANFSHFQGSGVSNPAGSGYGDVYISGLYDYGVAVRGSGSPPPNQTNFYLEHPVFRDPMLKAQGWNGDANGTIEGALADPRSSIISFTNGQGLCNVYGTLETQYGGSCPVWLFLNKAGNSLKDPVIIISKDYGWSGPNIYGWPVGAKGKLGVILTQYFKTDGWRSSAQEDTRFLKFVVSSEHGFNNDQGYYGIFIENNQADDGDPTTGTETEYVKNIMVNAEGIYGLRNGDTFPQDFIRNMTYYGDGVNPAFAEYTTGPGTYAGVHELNISWQDTVQYGQFKTIGIGVMAQSPDDPVYPFGTGNVIRDCSITGVIACENGTSENLIEHVTFLRDARAVIQMRGDSSVTLNDIGAPPGSTITHDGNGTYDVTLNGVSITLPYTIQPEDQTTTPVPEIPPNPLLD